MFLCATTDLSFLFLTPYSAWVRLLPVIRGISKKRGGISNLTGTLLIEYGMQRTSLAPEKVKKGLRDDVFQMHFTTEEGNSISSKKKERKTSNRLAASPGAPFHKYVDILILFSILQNKITTEGQSLRSTVTNLLLLDNIGLCEHT